MRLLLLFFFVAKESQINIYYKIFLIIRMGIKLKARLKIINKTKNEIPISTKKIIGKQI